MLAKRRLGLVGKAVAFDNGGISPGAKMSEMKLDLPGGRPVELVRF